MTRKKQSLLTVFLAIILLLPAHGGAALGADNPPYKNPDKAEIARKLEAVAREKNIPSVILKAIAYKESGWRQFDAAGNVVIGAPSSPIYNPGIGIMQIASYDPADTEEVNRLKYDIDYNISRGADILNEKWNYVPVIGDGDRNKLENWYFAIWAYNSRSTRNNPNLNTEAYQDKVIKVLARDYAALGLPEPVYITPISPDLLPLDFVPDVKDKTRTWETPEPYHLGDLHIGVGDNPSRAEPGGTVTRIAGKDRTDTVNQIALHGWPEGSETVILTRADDFPDALAGVALAAKYRAPILCTSPGRLDDSVIETLKALKPQKVIILGGEKAVSPSVKSKLEEILTWTSDITRLAGADRYQTAALIAQEIGSHNEVAIATGLDFPDALSLASAAAARGIPLLLATAQVLPQATLDSLNQIKPVKIYVAGGEMVIAPVLIEQLKKVCGLTEGNITRLAGSNRYETSVQVAQGFYPVTADIYMATGEDFIAPLAAGALAAVRNASLLLISPQGFTINGPTETYITQMPSSPNVKIFGGADKITEKTVERIKDLLFLKNKE